MRWTSYWQTLFTISLWAVIGACTPVTPAPSPTPDPPTATIAATRTAIAQLPTATETPLPPSPTDTATATATPTVINTATPTPTNTPTATLTPTPSIQQLTKGACCTQPFFSADSRQVFFLDKPSVADPVGIYAVTINNPEPAPVLISQNIGFRNPDQTLVANIDGNLVQLTNEETSESWILDTGGNWPRFSPDNSRILWIAADLEGPYDRRQSDVWLADISGENQRRLFTIYGTRTAAWFPDAQHFLMVGRDRPVDEEQTLFKYNVDTGQRTNLFSHKRIRGGDISPQGNWIAYFLTFADDPSENGLWIINAEDATRHKLEVPNFGAYRWRDDSTLLYIPFREEATSPMQLWAVDAVTGQSEPLTDPDFLPFSISNGDWDISPDGQYIVFVSSTDQNIWLITLP